MGGPGGRVEQRPLASMASIKMVEHQETSVQSQGHPLQRYTQTSTNVISMVKSCKICSVRVRVHSSSQRSPGTHVVRTNIVRSGKSVLFVIAADQTDAGGGEQQPRLQLCGCPADSRPDPSADHSPG